MIYLDNAATSFPKPEGVCEAMTEYMCNVGSNINRSVYGKSQEAGLMTLSLRESLKKLFNFPEKPSHVILTPGATWSINMVINGLLNPGDHCIVSSMEHNAVMRPLNALNGVEISRIPCTSDGLCNISSIESLIKSNTKLLIMSHVSNVCGCIQDIKTIGEICQQHNIFFVLDAAQSAGHICIDFTEMKLSGLCIPAHKGLLGPSGIGALLINDSLARAMKPIVAGGTGSASDSELTPVYLPDRFEPGTPDIPGIYGWKAALDYINTIGIENIRLHEKRLCSEFLTGLTALKNIIVYGPSDVSLRTGVICVNLKNMDNAEASFLLETEFNILTRCGLHCAPSAHKTLGTYPNGALRFSFNIFNTSEDIQKTLNALKKISEE